MPDEPSKIGVKSETVPLTAPSPEAEVPAVEVPASPEPQAASDVARAAAVARAATFLDVVMIVM